MYSPRTSTWYWDSWHAASSICLRYALSIPSPSSRRAASYGTPCCKRWKNKSRPGFKLGILRSHSYKRKNTVLFGFNLILIFDIFFYVVLKLHATSRCSTALVIIPLVHQSAIWQVHCGIYKRVTAFIDVPPGDSTHCPSEPLHNKIITRSKRESGHGPCQEVNVVLSRLLDLPTQLSYSRDSRDS